MDYVLFPVKSLDSAGVALEYLVSRKTRERSFIHLLNVQRPILIGEVTNVHTASEIARARQIKGREILRPIQTFLDAHGIDHASSVTMGDPAEAIARYAAEGGFASIVMSTRRMSAVGNVLFGSVAAKVGYIADVPITLVKRSSGSDVPALLQRKRKGSAALGIAARVSG